MAQKRAAFYHQAMIMRDPKIFVNEFNLSSLTKKFGEDQTKTNFLSINLN